LALTLSNWWRKSWPQKCGVGLYYLERPGGNKKLLICEFQ
jgi:hypothetical protein